MKKIIFYGIVALLAIGFSSCEKILTPKMKTSVFEESSLKNYTEVNSVLMGAYNTLLSTEYYGRGFIVVPDLLADATKITTANSNRYVNEQNNLDGSHVAIWALSYSVIAKANEVIARIPLLTEATASQKASGKGQAFFLRALAYHDLARSYSRENAVLVNGFDKCVPLVLTPFNGKIDNETFPERNTVLEVYAQINKDLDSAIVSFNRTMVGFPYQATTASAWALKARVNLYERNYSGAIACADSALKYAASKSLATAANYVTVFSKDQESIFALKVTTTENKTYDSPQSIHVRTNSDGSIGANGVGYGDITARTDTWNQFEAGDVRKSVIMTVTKSSQTVYWSLKWIGYGGAFGIDNTIILRTSELYLIKAEAYALKTPSDEVQSRIALNAIRTNRGLGTITPTGTALIDAIAKENRLEFLYEGHRLFDLKRRGLDITKGLASEGTTLPYSDYKVVARIPTSEMSANPNIVQNPGY